MGVFHLFKAYEDSSGNLKYVEFMELTHN